MKNYYLWIIGGAVVVVLGLFLSKTPNQGYNLSLDKSNDIKTTENAETTKTAVKTVAKTVPQVEELTNIFPSKGNYQCVYEEVTPSRRTTNVIYYSDGKLRGEFRIMNGASNIMLYDGLNLYAWVEGQSIGSVTRPKSISDFPSIIPKDITSGKVLGSGLNNVSWDCHAWTKVPSMLVKPSYVTFK
ncbi:MAG TPA: hypothetical protein VGC58_00660 [Candidatus Paceibacterota bacterium]